MPEYPVFIDPIGKSISIMSSKVASWLIDNHFDDYETDWYANNVGKLFFRIIFFSEDDQILFKLSFGDYKVKSLQDIDEVLIKATNSL